MLTLCQHIDDRLYTNFHWHDHGPDYSTNVCQIVLHSCCEAFRTSATMVVK